MTTFILGRFTADLPVSQCSSSSDVSEYGELTTRCQNAMHKCYTNLDSSIFHGKISHAVNTAYSVTAKILNVGTVAEFLCEDGWALNKAIKDVSTDNTTAHKIVCKKHGWFVLKNDLKTVGPKLLPCKPRQQCKVYMNKKILFDIFV